MPSKTWLKTTVIAAVLAGILSGIPSTAWALCTGGDVWEATLAAGAIVLSADRSFAELFVAATVVHGAMSLFWAGVLCAVLPRHRPVTAGLIAGALITVLDILLIGQAFESIRRLPFLPQLGDHLAFGAIVGAVVLWRHKRS